MTSDNHSQVSSDNGWGDMSRRPKVKVRTVEMSWTDAYGELFGRVKGIWQDEGLSMSDRVAAAEVARKLLWDMAHSPTLAHECSKDGGLRVA